MTMTKITCFLNGRLLNGIWNIFTTWPNDQFQMNCRTCQITPASRCAIWPTSLSTCCMANPPWCPHTLQPARTPHRAGFPCSPGSHRCSWLQAATEYKRKHSLCGSAGRSAKAPHVPSRGLMIKSFQPGPTSLLQPVRPAQYLTRSAIVSRLRLDFIAEASAWRRVVLDGLQGARDAPRFLLRSQQLKFRTLRAKVAPLAELARHRDYSSRPDGIAPQAKPHGPTRNSR